MAHPQNSPRGLFSKPLLIPTGKGVKFNDYSASSDLLTADSTGVVVAGKVKVSGSKRVGANSTGFIFDAASAKPATRSSAKWGFITNTTGVNGILLNTTGTTWKYVNVTSVLPT